MLCFLSCFIRLDFHRQLNGRRVGRRIYCFYANWINRMPSIVFDVHTVGVGCKDQVCTMSVRCYECCAGRTHVNWRYVTALLG